MKKTFLLIPFLFTSSWVFADQDVLSKFDVIPHAQESSSDEGSELLDEITPDADSALEKKLNDEKKLGNVIPNYISLYKINYILPYYYTASPYSSIYHGNTPENQPLNNSEFKGQLSLEVPLIKDLFYNEDMSLSAAFTELIYWQFYADSQYFRETDCDVFAYFKYHFHRNWLLNAGIDHQSNGKGGELERSWNRLVGRIVFAGENFFVQTEVWGLIFQSESSDLHNPDIEKFLGHENILVGYKLGFVTASLALQNVESGMHYGSYTATISMPFNDHLNFYAQYFNGYGQSLLEYDHRTEAGGIGVSFNNFL